MSVKDVSDFIATFTDKAEAAERLAVLAEGMAEQKAADLTLPRWNAMDLLAKHFENVEDIIAGIIQARSRNIISGPAKLGKTRFTFGIAIMVATGRNRMGFKVSKPHRVLYFLAEGGERMMQDRLKRMLAEFPEDAELLRQNLILCYIPTLKLTCDEHVDKIQNTIEADKPELVAFDPLYKFHSGDESSVKDMTHFFDALDKLISECGVAILLNHHHGKGNGEGLTTEAHMNRGSSTIADWADSLLTLTWEDKAQEVVKLRFTLRHAEEPHPMAFQRNPDTLWFDALSDYEFAGRAPREKVTDADIREVFARTKIIYSRAVEALAERCKCSEPTAKRAVRRARESGLLVEGDGGLLEVSSVTA